VNALAPLLIPALLGYFTLALLLRRIPLRWKPLFLLAAAIPTGFGICSLMLFFSLWAVPSKSMALSVSSGLAITLLLGGFLLRQYSKRTSPAPSAVELIRQKFIASMPKDRGAILKFVLWVISLLIFLVTLWSVIQFFLLSVSTNITGGWDARYMWLLKAKFMFRSPEAWQDMFSPLLSWSHTDYPLLWPGTLAWGWNWMGQESLLWPPWASLGFYLSCAMILVWYLGTEVSPLAGGWGGTFFLLLIPPLFWSIHLYTDLPLAFFITAATLLLLVALRSGHSRLFLISGLMAGLAAWTKNEGLQFWGITILLLASMKILSKRSAPHEPTFHLSPFLWGSCLPLVTVLIFKIFFGKSGEYLGPEHSLGDIFARIFSAGSETGLILLSFVRHCVDFASWKGLWIFFFTACLVFFFKKNRRRYTGILPTLVALINFGYVTAFLISPADLNWHLGTALERLLIHTAPLALVFSFEILTFRKTAIQK